MKLVMNATYIAIALSFIRKIVDKCTYEQREGLPVEHHDFEGCFCLCCGNICLEYTHDKFSLMRLGNHLMREIPKLSGRLKIVEDDNLCSCSAEAIKDLTPAEARYADEIVVSYDL